MQTEGRSRNALPPGTVLNGVYRVEVEVGQGGFGIVYRAQHNELGYRVAIKEYLPAELAVREGRSVHPRSVDCREQYQEGLRRFLEEAKQLIQFRAHPSIVSCRDFFRANGTAYLVMEYEEGLPLSELLQVREEEGRPFGEADLRKVMVPLLEGLARVHAAGVLHRDVKPANILVRREDERPVLIDFGAAKQNFAEHSKSLAPVTAGYAAIEQVGEGKLGPWTDLYAAGAVMWRMVAGGNRPFEPPNPVKVESRTHAVLREEADPLPSARELGRGRFSERVLGAIDQCLELREADRVQDCGELLGLLDAKRKRDEGRQKFTAADGSVWEGPVVDGQRQGHWVARRADGTVGEGPFVDGQRHGDWVWRFADGSVYDLSYMTGKRVSSVRRGVAPAAAEPRPDKAEAKPSRAAWKFSRRWKWIAAGFAMLAISSNQFLQNLNRGEGRQKFTTADGSVWEGPFVDGKKHGNWVVRLADGTVAEGPFVDDKRHGDWVERFADGTVGKGPYVDDKRHGDWVVPLADGSVQEGPYVDDKMHGRWVIRLADGSVAEGPFVDDKMHGRWVIRLADGTVQEGPYVDGKQHGNWVWRKADGTVYDVSYRNGEQVSFVRRK